MVVVVVMVEVVVFVGGEGIIIGCEGHYVRFAEFILPFSDNIVGIPDRTCDSTT